MNQKTNYSFDVYYSAESAATEAQRNEVMASLGPTLQQLLLTDDGAATVLVSDSHKGGANKLVELTTSLADERIAQILQGFSSQHGLTVTALE